MKIRSWKIWIPVMFVCLIGWGLTGPAMKQQAKVTPQIETPKKEFQHKAKPKAGPGKSGGGTMMYDLDMDKRFGSPLPLPPPPTPLPPPPPVPEKSSTMANVFFYGSGISILLNLLNFLEKIVALIRRIFRGRT